MQPNLIIRSGAAVLLAFGALRQPFHFQSAGTAQKHGPDFQRADG